MKDVTKIERIAIYKAYLSAAYLVESLLASYHDEPGSQFHLDRAHEKLEELADRMGYLLLEPRVTEHDVLVGTYGSKEDAA